MKIMEDPASGLAQQLLASEEFEKERREPWWEAPSVESDDVELSHLRQRFGAKPDPMLIPAAMVKPIPSGRPLHYNLCAIW